MNGKEMLEFYSNDQNLKPYVKIIENSDLVPLIMDSEDNILSLPPIINSDLSKIDLNTKNIFIDITATDLTKAHIALNIICSNFSIYSDTKCHFE
jgi:phenylalanyl-tRNA synthetase beta chain